jgi:hypothetical protein
MANMGGGGFDDVFAQGVMKLSKIAWTTAIAITA